MARNTPLFIFIDSLYLLRLFIIYCIYIMEYSKEVRQSIYLAWKPIFHGKLAEIRKRSAILATVQRYRPGIRATTGSSIFCKIY